MRSQAKAASAGSTTRDAARRFGLWRFVATAALGCIAMLLLASPSFAATITERPQLFTFNGADTPAGPFQSAGSIAVDNATGAVYVGEGQVESLGENRSVDRFHPDGTAWPFSSTGSASLNDEFTNQLGVAVDNSGGPEQSRLLVSQYADAQLKAFSAAGELQWTQTQTFGQPTDIAIDAAGHPWTSLGYEYANTGNPPASISSLGASGGHIDVDANGNVYLVSGSVEKYVGGVFDSILDPSASDVYADQSNSSGHIFTVASGADEVQEFTVDATAGQFKLAFGGSETGNLAFDASREEIQAAFEALPSVGGGDVLVSSLGDPAERHYVVFFQGFLSDINLGQIECEDGTIPLSGGSGCTVSPRTNGEPSDFQEYGASGTLLGTFGTEYLSSGASIAYNPTLDRVYVLQGGEKPSVSVFGPAVSGTVADVTADAPSSIGVSSAHFSGTVNPQGTTSEWRFQWRKLGQGWGEASSSPAQTVPADSSDHTVEYTTNALRGGSSYQVRLVAVNTANQLNAVSTGKTFATAKASQVPDVTIDPPNVLSMTAAKISGTVNPNGDTASWRVQISTDPECQSGFSDQAMQEISEGSTSPVSVEYEVNGLLPAEPYCARIAATNSFGTTTSEPVIFETQNAQPTQVFTGYVAPRTDTSARLNGYVNPQGSEATYRFEYSSDGSNWTPLPDLQTRRSRSQIVVAEEVTGLQPGTTYHYRFSVENSAGPASPQGDKKIFTTRTTDEMAPPQRGIELVNQPDKGNQNVHPYMLSGGYSPMTPDGNKVIWSVNGGAPGGNVGTGATFLSTRLADGWHTKSLIPPAAEQAGGGSNTYQPIGASTDLSKFVFRSSEAGVIYKGPPTIVRLDESQNQETLKEFHASTINEAFYGVADMTDDTSHVFMTDLGSGELEDIGSGASEVVSILPEGQPNECPLGFEGQSFTGSGSTGAGAQWQIGYHRVATTDGSRVYFEAKPNGKSCSGPQSLYVRDRETNETTLIDAGSEGVEPELVRATPDGRSVYFVTSSRLAPSDTNNGGDVYSWDAVTGEYTCMTCVLADADVSGQVLISDDFSHVYFESQRGLVSGYGNPHDSSLYVLSDGQVKFVTDINVNLRFLSTELSSTGNVLAFSTSESLGNLELTADPLANSCLNHYEESTSRCPQLFRYDDRDSSLECVSCRHNGTTKQMSGNASVGMSFRLSADGETLAFVTREALVPEDINNVYDVYQWHGGSTSLVTDGETRFPVGEAAPKVAAIDRDGSNILFTVVDRGLTGYEADGLENLYDARIGGGFERPSVTAHCAEDSCQGPLQAAPATGTSGSAALVGAGNRIEVKKKARCGQRRGNAKKRCARAKKQHRHHSHHAKAKGNAGSGK